MTSPVDHHSATTIRDRLIIGGHISFDYDLPEDTVFQCFLTNTHAHFKPKRIETVLESQVPLISNTPRVVHASYVTFPWSTKDSTRDDSIEDIKIASHIANAINIQTLVVHLSRAYHCIEGFDDVVQKCLLALESPCTLAFENTTGMIKDKCKEIDTTPALALSNTQRAIERVILNSGTNKDVLSKKSWGFCLDTCHAFAQGQALTTSANVKQFIKEIEGVNVVVIHLNGSHYPLKSGKDKHAVIGSMLDYIWSKDTSGLKTFLKWAASKKIPLILERNSFCNIADYKKEITKLTKLFDS